MDFRNDILPLKNALYRLALRITLNAAEAEDVVQETMIRVWQKRDEWAEIKSTEAFCMTICRNLALDRAKKAANKTLSLDVNARQSDYGDNAGDSGYTPVETIDTSPSANPESHTERKESINIVRTIIDSLPEKQRTIVQLREIEGKTYKEIADILAVSEEQVKVNLFRARQTIKARFARVDAYDTSR